MFLRISANERGKREFSQNLSQPHRAASGLTRTLISAGASVAATRT